MEKTIKASLIYIGRTVPWLADQLGISRSGIYKKLRDDRWDLNELRMMKKIFRWATLEG